MGLITETIGGLGAIGYGLASSWLSSATDALSSSNNYVPSASITVAHSKLNADILAELKKDIRSETEKKKNRLLTISINH